MTSLQKQIISQLLQDGTIAKYPRYPYRLRDAAGNVQLKFNENTFRSLKNLLRKRKDSLIVIDKNEVRKLRGNAWAKQQYKQSLKIKQHANKNQH